MLIETERVRELLPAQLRIAADEMEALRRVAVSADLFLAHIAGFRIAGDNGEIVDVFNRWMPEAVALRTALAAWKRGETASHVDG